jgi:hypothetical protein
MSDKAEDIIQSEVSDVLALQKTVEEMEQELAKNEVFQNFLTKQKEARTQIDATWKKVEEQMIEHNVKSIKGEWGSITIAERTNYKADLDLLPSKFIKKVADTAKIATYAKLENKLPKGVTTSLTKYLTKRIK